MHAHASETLAIGGTLAGNSAVLVASVTSELRQAAQEGVQTLGVNVQAFAKGLGALALDSGAVRAPRARPALADPRLRVGRAVRKKFTGSGWFDGSVTSIADGSFEVRWSDGDETSYPFKAATKMLDAAEGAAVAPVAAAVAAPVVE